MSSLLETLLSDIKECMKSGQKDRLLCLRGLHSDIKKVSIDSQKEITNDLILDVLTKSLKQRNDSRESFEKAKREDLLQNTLNEISWIKQYLPQELSPAELEVLVSQAIQESGAVSKKDMGLVMKLLIPQTKGRADSKILSQLINSKLA